MFLPIDSERLYVHVAIVTAAGWQFMQETKNIGNSKRVN